MRAKPIFVLLDLDGVLVEPGGYRAAYHASIRHILSLMHLESCLPQPDVPDIYEACSVASEWDMLPITLALVLESVYQHHPHLPVAPTIEQAISSLNGGCRELDYNALIRALSPSFDMADTPSHGVYELANQEKGRDFFPRLRGTRLLEELLLHTRDIERSYVNRLLQNFVLGNALFADTYALDPLVQVESLLKTHDQILVSAESISSLLKLQANREIHTAVFTFRPSLPPREVPVSQDGYSAEAEAALALLGLTNIPLIGYGRIQHLARCLQTTPDRLIKPSPVQALAAIAAAWTGSELNSLFWAYAQVEKLECGYLSNAHPFSDPELPDEFDLHVFEDSVIGLRSTQEAVRVLAQGGRQIRLHAWGITYNEAKKSALDQAGAQLYPTVDDAWRHFVQQHLSPILE